MNVDLRVYQQLTGATKDKLAREIESARLDIKQLDVNIAHSKAELVRWVVAVG